jgi:hypothetical protein
MVERGRAQESCGEERACGLVIPDRASTHQVCEEQEGEEQRVQATVEQSRGVYVKGWHTVEQWQQAGIARAGVHGPRFGMKARVVWGACGQRGKAQAGQLDSDAMAAETDTATSAEEVEQWEACFWSAAVAPVPCRPVVVAPESARRARARVPGRQNARTATPSARATRSPQPAARSPPPGQQQAETDEVGGCGLRRASCGVRRASCGVRRA